MFFRSSSSYILSLGRRTLVYDSTLSPSGSKRAIRQVLRDLEKTHNKSEEQVAVLKDYIKTSGLAKARDLLADLIVAGKATSPLCNVVLKEMVNDASSKEKESNIFFPFSKSTLDKEDETKKMVELMEVCNLADGETYNVLLGHLMNFGTEDEASVLRESLIQKGFDIDVKEEVKEEVKPVLSISNVLEEKQRIATSQLMKYIRNGKKNGLSKAKRLFLELLETKVANEYHCHIMLSHCEKTNEAHDLLKKAEEADVHSNTKLYNILVHRYILDGRFAKARNVLEEMDNNGIRKDDRTRLAFDVIEKKLLDKWRENHLLSLMHSKNSMTRSRARLLLNALEKRMQATKRQRLIVEGAIRWSKKAKQKEDVKYGDLLDQIL
eukprot:g31.t1